MTAPWLPWLTQASTSSTVQQAVGQVRASLSQFIRDPFGTIVGVVKHQASDLKQALFSITKEELDNPQIRARLVALGVDPTKLEPTATANEVARAGGRTMALATGFAAGGAMGAALGPATSWGPAAYHGAAEALAFGVTAGALTPVEEEQTRAGNILTYSVFAVPFGTLGGLTSFGISKALRSQGVKPELDAPEIANVPPEFDPVVAASAPKPSNLPARTRPTAVDIAEGTATGEPFGLLPGKGTVAAPVAEVLRGISIGEKPVHTPLTASRVYTALLDDLHPINAATKDLLRLERAMPRPSVALVRLGETPRATSASLTPSVRLPAMRDPYVLARLTRGSTAKATQFLESGPLDFQTLQPVGPGLREILEPIVQAGKLNEFRAFLVSPRALEYANRGLKTPFSPEAAQAVIKGASNDVVQAGLNAFRYNDQLLDYVQQSGLVSQTAVDAMRAMNKHYVPFFRFIDTAAETLHYPNMESSKFANIPTGIRRVGGGSASLKIVDPLESMVKNTYALVNLADRHIVAQSLVELAERIPEQTIVRKVGTQPVAEAMSRSTAIELQSRLNEIGVALPEGVAREIADAFQSARTVPEGQFWVLKDGQKTFYEVDSELWRALMQVDREQTNTFIKILAAPATLQRVGFTAAAPSFVFRNPFRDQFTASVHSRYGFKPGVDLTRGIFHVLGNDELYTAFQRSGGEHAVLARTLATERVATQRTVNNLLQSDSPLAKAWRTVRSPKGWFEGLRRLNELNEDATRSQEFVRALAQLQDPRLAAFAARDVTLDFSRVGHSMRIANQVIPFLNAQLQDLDKIARTFTAEGGTRSLGATARAVGYITMPSIALYLLNRDDPNFHELSAARRDLFWNIPLWSFNDEQGRWDRSGKFFSVPKPFLLGMMFGTVPERTLEWIDQRDPKLLDEMAKNMLGAASVPMMPGALTPIIENITNYDFFGGRPLIPESEKRLIAEERAGPLQGETVRLVGKALNTSPRNVENLINGYTGGLGRTVTAVTDALLRQAGVKRPQEPTRPPLPVPFANEIINSFIVNEPTVSSLSVERFYTKWGEIQAAMTTVRSFAQQGRGRDIEGLAHEMRPEIAAYPLFTQASGAIAELNTAIRSLRTNHVLTREAREQQILLIGRTIRTIAGKAMEAYGKLQNRLVPKAGGMPDTLGHSVAPLDSVTR